MKIFGSHQDATLRQLVQVGVSAERVALMADGHVGYVMPIGGVAAYRGKVSVVGVGFDIACGNAAVRTDLTVEALTDGLSLEEIRRNPFRFTQNRRAVELTDEIAASVSFGIGRRNRADDAPVDDPLFLDPAWYAIPTTGSYRDDLREVVATYTDDALLLLPGAAEPVRGKAGISRALAGYLPLVGPIAVSLGDGDVADSAVYLFGRYFSGEDAGTDRSESGTYMMLLRREGREWRIRAQTFRADPAGVEGDTAADAQQ